MPENLIRPYLKTPLAPGWNPFLENDTETELDFGIHVLLPCETQVFRSDTHEMALLILNGKGVIRVGGDHAGFARSSWIEQPPWSAHFPAGAEAKVIADRKTEIAVIRTPNTETFAHHIYLPDEVENEHRGMGMLNDASYRIVRCVFDRRWAPEAARLVLGEVVNFPGRWSSYPPHHHPQKELYYYRFDPDWGYGHGELGEEVYKLRHHDLLRITGTRDHAQVSAPGFHMYYLWTIAHLPGDPYTGFEYTEPFGRLIEI